MNEYLLSLLIALGACVDNLSKAVSDVQTALAKVLGHICGSAFSDAEKCAEEPVDIAVLPSSKPAVKVFKRKEYAKMTEAVRVAFKEKLIKAHIRVRKDGLYEVRAQVNKRVYTGAGKTEDLATAKFIECVNRDDGRITSYVRENKVACEATLVSPKFSDYATMWLDVVKKPNVKDFTYKTYSQELTRYIIPVFGKKQLNQISAIEVQKFINEFCDKGNFRTAKQLRALLRSIFEYAVADGVLTNSPMKKVETPKFEPKESKPLTRDEERRLVEALREPTGDRYTQAYVFLLYTGLRRSELATASMDDKFVTVDSAKCRKGKKQKTRRIPITPMLAEVMPYINLTDIKTISASTLSEKAPKYLFGHHTHELRHTFITRCQECGVRREIVSLWVGHEADTSITTTVYTHLEQNDEIQTEAASLVKYKL